MTVRNLPHHTGKVLFALGLLAAVLMAPLGAAQVGLPGSGGGKDSGGGGDAGLGDAVDGFAGGLSDMSFTTGIMIGIGTTLLLGLLAGLFFMGGTKFVNADNVLENDARRSIFEHIVEHPGTHLRQTASVLSLSTTNVLWHMRKLEQANLVHSRKFEGYKVFYPTAGGVESRRKALANAVLRNENAMSILEYVVANPSAHQREIARALGVNHGTIRWHLRKLNDAGLVMQIKKEHTSQYYVSELGVQFLSPEAARMAAKNPGFQVPSPEEERAVPATSAAPAQSGIVRHD